MGLDMLFFAGGLLLLYLGAEGLVGGASGITLRLGVKPLVVGLTVVAFGTSSPELVVCLAAAFEGNDAISIGNIIGSNIANIALILGVSALVRPLDVRRQAVRREYPLMVLASCLLTLLLFVDLGARELSRIEGGILLACMAGYLLYAYYSTIFASAEQADVELDEVEPATDADGSKLVDVAKLGLGIPALGGGAYLMVDAATSIATDLGISPIVIGITIVAFGTSLPELATSVISSVRDEADISVGNVIGSNLFNVLLVLGLVAVITPLHVESHVLKLDIWVMLGVSVGLWPIFRFGDNVNRFEGGLMLLVYGIYVAWLFARG